MNKRQFEHDSDLDSSDEEDDAAGAAAPAAKRPLNIWTNHDEYLAATTANDVIYVSAHGSIGNQRRYWADGVEYALNQFDEEKPERATGPEFAWYEVPASWQIVYLTSPGYVILDESERAFWDTLAGRMTGRSRDDYASWFDAAQDLRIQNTPVNKAALEIYGADNDRLKNPIRVFRHGDPLWALDVNIDFADPPPLSHPQCGVYGLDQPFSFHQVWHLQSNWGARPRTRWQASELLPRLIAQAEQLERFRNGGTIVLCTCMKYSEAGRWSDMQRNSPLDKWSMVVGKHPIFRAQHRDNLASVRSRVLAPCRALHSMHL